MKYTIKPNFFFLIIFFIVGGALLRQFDFQNLTFENTALSVIYLIVFIASIGLMIKKSKKVDNNK